jgi:two-component system LytT family response regulator
MTPLAVAIVDDEALARHRLRRLLLKVGGHDIAIVLECVDAVELLERSREAHVDVLFLDIEMPGGDAFDILRRWQGPRPDVVLVTAHEAYGVRAFDARVVDYLLKPLSADRLRETLDRLRERAPAGSRRLDDGEQGARIALQVGQRTHLVPVGQIDAVVAQGNYIDVFVGGDRYAIRRSLASFEDELDAAMFVRLHRSVIVRRAAIREIRPLGSGRFRLELHGGRHVHSGRSYATQVRRLLEGTPR